MNASHTPTNRPGTALGATQLAVRVEALGLSLPLDEATDFAGVVTGVGQGVRGLREGSRVFGAFPGRIDGSVVVVESSLTRRSPTPISARELATLPTPVALAVRGLDLAGLSAGERVLIVGAASAVGTVALQIARDRGATTIGLCRDRDVPFVRDVGAHETLAEERLASLSVGKFDVIFDGDGTLSPRSAETLLKPTGCSLHVAQGEVRCHRSGVVTSEPSLPCQHTLAVAIEATQSGHLVPVIDRLYPAQRINRARERAESGRARGCVVVDFLETREAGL